MEAEACTEVGAGRREKMEAGARINSVGKGDKVVAEACTYAGGGGGGAGPRSRNLATGRRGGADGGAGGARRNNRRARGVGPGEVAGAENVGKSGHAVGAAHTVGNADGRKTVPFRREECRIRWREVAENIG